jgi:hypothetical protein
VYSSELTVFKYLFFKVHGEDDPTTASNMHGDEEALIAVIGDPLCLFTEPSVGPYFPRSCPDIVREVCIEVQVYNQA